MIFVVFSRLIGMDCEIIMLCVCNLGSWKYCTSFGIQLLFDLFSRI